MNRQASPHRSDSILYVLKARSRGGPGWVEAHTIVDHGEMQVSIELLKIDPDLRRSCVLGRILQRFQAAEVDGRFELRVIAANPARGNGCVRAERRHQSLLAQRRWIDVLSKLDQRPDRVAGLRLQLLH